MHHLYRADSPPGAIGHHQHLRGDRAGSVVWVRLSVPRGVISGVADAGTFVECPADTGIFQLGCGLVYRFRLRNLPGGEETELFPSIELIDRTSPPPGQEHAFPVVIQLDDEDLRAAAGGALVVRVVAVEDPQHPVLLDRSDPARQEVFDVSAPEDPLQVADMLGRPVAIVRMGSARPCSLAADATFCFGFPPASLAIVAGGGPGEGAWRMPHSSAAVFPSSPSPCRPDVCGEVEWQPRADEVICDGGDDGPRARVRAGQMGKGLAVTETAASFRTDGGDHGYATSNRVCLYAPRFFATRKMIPVLQQDVVLQAAGMDALTPSAGPSQSMVPARAVACLQARQRAGARLRHSLQDAQPGRQVENQHAAEALHDQHLPHETGVDREALVAADGVSASTAVALQPAVEWTRAQAAEVVLDDEVAWEQRNARGANEGVIYEARPGARLQLRKSVSCVEEAADQVRFTIRFDNIGTETLRDVVIHDFLSARLGLQAESPRCSLVATMATERDTSGATNVQWRITEPLPAGHGGTIEFHCLVR